MEQAPLVSITCMAYNHERFIGQAIDSFLMQETDFPFEILIGEDCSKDGTRSIIEKYQDQHPDKITLITSEKNVGARKNGVRLRDAAKGKYIAICEGDDYWTDVKKLQKQVDFLEGNPEICLTFHSVNVVDEENNILITGKAEETKIMSRESFFHVSIPPLSVVFRNVQISYPSEYFEVFNGDAFLFGMLSKYGKIAKLGFNGAAYRKHMGGTFSSRSYFDNAIKSIETRELMLKSNIFDDKDKWNIKRAIRRKKMNAIKYYLRRMNLLTAYKMLLR